MKPYNLLLFILLLAATLQACSMFYFGHTQEEWNNLTEAEKTAAKAEYQRAIDLREAQKHSDKINSRTESVIDYGAGKRGPTQQ